MRDYDHIKTILCATTNKTFPRCITNPHLVLPCPLCGGSCNKVVSRPVQTHILYESYRRPDVRH